MYIVLILIDAFFVIFGGTKTQKAKGIPDNAEIFTQDTLKGGAKKPELAKLLCVNSADDVVPLAFARYLSIFRMLSSLYVV